MPKPTKPISKAKTKASKDSSHEKPTKKAKVTTKITLTGVRLHGLTLKGKAVFVFDGVVKNHPKLPDGYITTSVIKWIDFESMTAQTKNTLFHIKWAI